LFGVVRMNNACVHDARPLRKVCNEYATGQK